MQERELVELIVNAVAAPSLAERREAAEQAAFFVIRNQDSSAFEREQALLFLTRFNLQAHAETLADESKPSGEREEAARMIGALGEKGIPAAYLLFEAMKSPDKLLQSKAREAVKAMEANADSFENNILHQLAGGLRVSSVAELAGMLNGKWHQVEGMFLAVTCPEPEIRKDAAEGALFNLASDARFSPSAHMTASQVLQALSEAMPARLKPFPDAGNAQGVQRTGATKPKRC